MAKRPSFQWYPGDWLRDAALRSCSIEARGLWADLLCIMHDCEPYGHLAVNGHPLTDSEVAPMVGLPIVRYRKLLAVLEGKGIARRSDTGALYSKRMVRDEEIRVMRQQVGKLGGNPALLSQPPVQPPPQPKPPTPVNRQDNQMVAAADKEVVGSSGGGVGEGIGEMVPAMYRDAYQGHRRAHRNPMAFDAELKATATGMRGHPFTWPEIGRALQEMAAAGATFSPNALRGFCRKLTDGTPAGLRLERRGSLRAIEEAKARATGEVA